MKAVGVIVEYNPFHNGHAFHLESSKEKANADIAIAVMSGNFLQRGEPALVSKWSRTKMALLAGVDIVFELPYQFATQKAETFANGSISILSAAGCDSVCFGSESGDMEQFLQTMDFLEEHNHAYQDKIQSFVSKGLSYPSATSAAFKEIATDPSLMDLSKPNNILGYQYIKAVREQSSSMKIHTVTRKNADYHDEHFASETIASATSIRKALFSQDGNIENVQQYVPHTTYQSLLEYREQIGAFHSWDNYWAFLKYKILQTSADELRDLYEIEEGLENRLISTALTSNSFHEFMTKLKTKRYTWTRLQRACVHVLMNTKKNEMRMNDEKATYLRLLGMTQKGREYLNKNKENFALPLVSKVSSFHNPGLDLDIKASRIYALGAPEHSRQALNDMEFNQPPIIII